MSLKDINPRNNYYIVRLDMNECVDYPELYKYKQFRGDYITRLDKTLVFDIGKDFEQLIYIPYNWILWMIPDNNLE